MDSGASRVGEVSRLSWDKIRLGEAVTREQLRQDPIRHQGEPADTVGETDGRSQVAGDRGSLRCTGLPWVRSHTPVTLRDENQRYSMTLGDTQNVS
jgi:hypothetical protein